MNFEQRLNKALGIKEESQGEEISYFVEYDDGTVLGYRPEEKIPVSQFELGKSFDTSEEANRWAAEIANGRLWRILKVDLMDNKVEPNPWVTPIQAAEWQAAQQYRWDPAAPAEDGAPSRT